MPTEERSRFTLAQLTRIRQMLRNDRYRSDDRHLKACWKPSHREDEELQPRVMCTRSVEDRS